ncbi:MAG TPA: hypothetical protein VNM92_08215 [Thermoanaerobaculia bacterium]|nr:hypothetical protein [Thermoanaerobaculia bacterium]
MLLSTRTLLAAIMLIMLTGCGQLRELPTEPIDPGSEPIDPSATLTRVQSEIFTPTCATIGCHDPAVQQGSLVLSPGRSFAELVGKPSAQVPQTLRVRPLDPDRSYLYMKVIGAPGITGDRMPQNAPALSQAQRTLIRDWIRRGAPND